MLDSNINAERLAHSAAEIAATFPEPISVYPSAISKLLNGHTLTASRQQLNAILPALSDDARVHTDLIIAHLRDHCYGPNADKIEIRAKLTGTRTPRPKAMTNLERALATLAEVGAGNSAVAASLIAQAKAFRPE